MVSPLVLSALCLAFPGPRDAEPEWIWHGPAHAEDTLWTCHEVQVGEGLRKAVLRGSCDNVVEVFLGGEPVVQSMDWTRPFSVDVTTKLSAGVTALAARARNQGGPAGLWLQLDLEYEDGRQQHLVTDTSWQVSRRETAGWRRADGSREGWAAAHSFGALGVEPWGTPGETEAVSDTGALPADQLTLPEGFAAELVYSIPKAEQGSWVVLCFDDRGRIIASDQYGGLYRMTPPPLGQADGELEVERLEVAPGHAQGLLWAFDSLYVMVAEGGEGNGLYRVRDTDGDDEFDESVRLKFLGSGGEHGPHAILLGPDGDDLFVLAGNHVPLPEGITRYRPTTAWGEDQLLPRLPDPNGHANGKLAPGGWVCRINPDGTEWELVAMGMRNSYDMAFNPDGELFTFDADMEWDIGLPWYRPTRVCHLVSGADFGWRFGSGKWPAHYPDSLPAAVDIGLGSPTGVVFGTDAAFHGKWREALFVADWAYGQIFAVQLEPDGASYGGTFELFASGKPFAVTDMAVGPDGALYVTTGGRRTQSGLYRIYSTQDPAPRPSGSGPSPARAARRVIERNHGLGTPSAFWSELGSQDRFLAHAARTTLEQSPVADWAERALAEENPRVALQALIALARVAPGDYGARLLARLDSLEVESWSSQFALPFVRLFGLVYIRVGAPDPQTAARHAAKWEGHFPSGDPRLDRELCRLLVFLNSPRAAEQGLLLLEAAEAAGDQETQIHYAYCLSNLSAGWTQPLRRRYFRWLSQVGPTLKGGHSLQKYLAAIRESAVERLPQELRAHPELLSPPAVDVATVVPVAASFVRSWTMEDLAPLLSQTKTGRDFSSGRRAFAKATCAECHRLGGEGGSTGPDLTGAGGRFSARDLLESLLEPSKAISDQYQELELITEDDLLHVGRVAEEDDGWIVLLTPQGERIEVDKSEVKLRRPHPISRMPSGLLDVLEQGELLDLIAYCLAGGRENDPAFRR
jgi:putative heme-binding domain-containing protein